MLLACKCLGQNVEQTLSLANSLFEMQQYEAALKHYHRVAFFGDDKQQAYAFPAIGQCYFEAAQYEKSIFYYELASNAATCDSLASEYLFAKVLCHFLLDNYDFALQDLYSFHRFESQYFSNRYHFYHAIISLKKNSPDTALVHFLNATYDSSQQQALVHAFRKARLNRPNPKTAMVLSILVPGLGQFYAGDYRNAANSFLLNSILFALSYSITLRNSLADALMSTIPWLQRYYMGGFTNAELIALARKNAKRNQLLLQAISIMDGSLQ
ncbi:MAG: hypothetical protein U1C46_01915 [Bacteroidales bacterium]|nr:hypothetical protein [Bacteroidales bacterium]MDZ4203551.1 hypothetical protein [Bacteroidales bacterium]